MVHDAQQALQVIQTHMSDTSGMVSTISSASDAQQGAMNQIADSVEQIANKIQLNLNAVSQTRGAVDNLNLLVERMQKAVQQYSV